MKTRNTLGRDILRLSQTKSDGNLALCVFLRQLGLDKISLCASDVFLWQDLHDWQTFFCSRRR